MNYKGVIIEESLRDASLIKQLDVIDAKVGCCTCTHLPGGRTQSLQLKSGLQYHNTVKWNSG